MSGGRFTALVPAAGFSSRMGFFKPLMPFGPLLLIEKTVNTFRSVGINDIRVIVGYKRELLLPVLKRLSTQIIINDKFADGMYSSVKAGVRSLGDSTAAFFILPGDCAFLEAGTVKSMADAYTRNPGRVIYPVNGGRRGHPVLIPFRLTPLIINSDPAGGLKALLEENHADSAEVPVQDPGIHYDMDNAGDYLKLPVNGISGFPSEKKCLEILAEAGVNEDIILHSKEVSRAAVRISEHLNSRGCRINFGLVMAAGLLHDIARDQPEHPKRGSGIISGLGYKEIADIIAVHMDIAPAAIESLNEAAIVYLADKLVKGSRVVSLEDRFADSLEKHGNNIQIEKKIRNRFNNAVLIKKKVEEITGQSVEEILAE